MGTRVLIVGGDFRSRKLLDIMREADIETNGYLLLEEELENPETMIMNADIVVLPANHTGGEIKGTRTVLQKHVVCWAKQGAYVFCGKADAELKELAAEYEFHIIEFLEDERFQIYNAYLTAEGAVKSAIEHTHGSLVNAQCAVVGSGRIADAIAYLLRPFTTNIRIVARNVTYLERARMQGHATFTLDDRSL